MKTTRTPGQHETPAAVMTQEELQAAVIAFANRFVAGIGQASAQFERQLPTPDARLMASSRRVYSLMAASEIAAGPNPGAALLDMVVLTSLNRMVWDEYWRPQVFGMPATVMVEAFKDLEKDIWRQASQVMTAGQREELREILQDWWINHPRQFAVDYVRFSDFGDIGKKPNLKEIQKPGGLLAPIREATQAVDEVRMTSERAIFLLTKMQLIASFQIELAYKHLMFQPETRKLLKQMDDFSVTAKEMEVQIEALPGNVSRERKAVVNDVSRLLERERSTITAMLNGPDTQALFTRVNATLEKMNQNVKTLNQGLAAADHVLEKGEQTGRVFTELVRTLDQFTGQFLSEEAEPGGRPFDITDYTKALAQMERSTEQLTALLQSISSANEQLSSSLMSHFNAAAERQVDHIFIRLAQLCLIAGLMVFGLILAARYLGRHPKG